MTPELYSEIKSTLDSYSFDEQSNFYDLYRFARKPHASRYGGFKAFCRFAKIMGVSSKVVKVNGKAVRHLVYTPVSGKTLNSLLPLFDICPNCQGSGTVKISFT